ncbi:hypothetical protein MFLAVUS_000107 [Mucor flavus]|uniref:Uncharacterized protein n=1 Tax=Mucor flavus TaxID=439312 RepID=A0ABP9YIS7_9FUNG
MSDQEDINYDEQPIFTQRQMEELIELVTLKVRTEQLQESELRDETLIRNAFESLRKLAVYGFGAAKLQESEARDSTLKAIKLPPTLKHLQPQQSSGDKKYAFGDDFLEQYYDETFKQQITSQSTNNRGGYTRRFDSHGYRGRGGYNNNNRSRPFRGRGRGAWSQQPQQNRSYAPPANNPPSDNHQ